MSDRLRFQGKCLQAEDGFRHMVHSFDKMPRSVRERLRNSPFNLCAACVRDIVWKMDRHMDATCYYLAIDQMEAAIRAEG